MFSKNLIHTNKCKSWFTRVAIRLFYDSQTRNDTIFASSTAIHPQKGSPLGVIRVSGTKTSQVLLNFTGLHVLSRNNIFQSATTDLKPRHATLCKVFKPNTSDLIDMSLVLWFPKPNSFTGEDVCEFHLHGSQAIMTTMLNSLGNLKGLRPAEPGEFTRRAVSNRKISLHQAESLPDLIASKTEHQRKMALRGLDGSTRLKMEHWIKELTIILAHLEASIDFGEDELIGEVEVVNKCIDRLRQLSNEIDKFRKVSSRCKDIIQSGLRAVILGKPNSGKSTLMNLLCRCDKSIVSDLSGTTRDIVEHSIELGGHSVILCDTAGLKNIQQDSTEKVEHFGSRLLEKHLVIEREGIRKALDIAREADIILYLIDGSELFSRNDISTEAKNELDEVLSRVFDGDEKLRVLHIIVNKIDLNFDLNRCNFLMDTLKNRFGKNIEVSFISCITGKNYESFVDRLSLRLEYFLPVDQVEPVSSSDKKRSPNAADRYDYVNERHLSLLSSTQRHLELASNLDISTIDEMAQHVRESVDYLSRIVGTVTNEEVIDVIFRDFCIGK